MSAWPNSCARPGQLAFSVRADKRGQKIGTRLMQEQLLRARMGGIAKVSVLFLPDNTPMRRMASRAGMTLRFADGEACAELEQSTPTAQELAQWFVEQSLAYGACFGNLGIACRGALLSLSANATPLSLGTSTPTA